MSLSDKDPAVLFKQCHFDSIISILRIRWYANPLFRFHLSCPPVISMAACFS
jgi:hypothetical protein